MAFVYQRLEELHNASGEMAIEFSRAVFGPTSKLGIEYFRNKTSISTAHLEKICMHYNKPMAYFFDSPILGGTNVENYVAHNKIGVGNLNLTKDVEYLKGIISDKERQIKDKDDIIVWMKKQYESAMETVKILSKT